MLKKCAKEKNLEFCFQCNDFPCKDLESFKNDKQYPYHGEIYTHLKSIEKSGKDSWIAEMKKHWSCPSCKTEFNWWNETCPFCGGKTSGYNNPNV